MHRKLFIVFILYISLIFSQDKQKELYGVILKDSTTHIGYIISTDPITRIVTFSDTSGLQTQFSVDDIRYQNRIKNKSDLDKFNNYNYDKKTTGIKILHSIHSFFINNKINLQLRIGFGLLTKIANSSLNINYLDNPATNFEYKDYDRIYKQNVGGSAKGNKKFFSMDILYKKRIAICFSYGFTNDPYLTEEYIWPPLISYPDHVYGDEISSSYQARYFSPNIKYYLPFNLKFIKFFSGCGMQFNTIDISIKLSQFYIIDRYNIKRTIITIEDKKRLKDNEYFLEVGANIIITRFASIFVNYHYSKKHEYKIQSISKVGRTIIPNYNTYSNRDYLYKLKSPYTIINFGVIFTFI